LENGSGDWRDFTAFRAPNLESGGQGLKSLTAEVPMLRHQGEGCRRGKV
jgi:hypothetical protein